MEAARVLKYEPVPVIYAPAPGVRTRECLATQLWCELQPLCNPLG